MAETLIIKELEKSFGDKKILNKISLICEAGKVYGIVGYNGSGKTVLFKCICGFMIAEKGEILIKGISSTKRKDQMNDIGVIIEEPAFIKGKSGYQNLEYLFLVNHRKNNKLLYETMEKVGLNPKEKKPVGKYSMGMKQRLAIAQAIMEDPDILILDEPMNGLDKLGVKEIRELLLQLRDEGKTILLASHNKEDIEILCDSVYEIDNGILTQVEVK